MKFRIADKDIATDQLLADLASFIFKTRSHRRHSVISL